MLLLDHWTDDWTFGDFGEKGVTADNFQEHLDCWKKRLAKAIWAFIEPRQETVRLVDDCSGDNYWHPFATRTAKDIAWDEFMVKDGCSKVYDEIGSRYKLEVKGA